jgi:Mrp family chromosome partitioning ATPase
VTSPLVDCFLLVVEWGQSKIDVVQHALHTAPNIHECMIGAVFNKADIKTMMRYEAYLRDYHSDKHYTHYGFSDAG